MADEGEAPQHGNRSRYAVNVFSLRGSDLAGQGNLTEERNQIKQLQPLAQQQPDILRCKGGASIPRVHKDDAFHLWRLGIFLIRSDIARKREQLERLKQRKIAFDVCSLEVAGLAPP